MLQALPLFLNRLVDPVTTVVLSVTVLLVFGECLVESAAGGCKPPSVGDPADSCSHLIVQPLQGCDIQCQEYNTLNSPRCCCGVVVIAGEVLPQAVCSHYGLQVGANSVWFVRALMYLTAPVSWPVAKLLDLLLGGHHAVGGRMHKTSVWPESTLHVQSRGFR